MYGAVLWRDSAQRRAVFWCADHGALAHYCGAAVSEADLQVGDMVVFDIARKPGPRVAEHVRLIATNGYAELPESLLRAAASEVGRRLGDPQRRHSVDSVAKNVVAMRGRGTAQKATPDRSAYADCGDDMRTETDPGDADLDPDADDPDGNGAADSGTGGADYGANVLTFRSPDLPRKKRQS